MEIEDLEDALKSMSVWERRLVLRDQNRKYRRPDRQAFTRHLYRYIRFDNDNLTGNDRLLSALAGGEIFLSSFDQFNDPFECQARITLQSSASAQRHLREAALRVFKDQPRNKRRAEAKAAQKRLEQPGGAKNVLRQNVSSVGITCFSEDPRSILMWSHYACGHTGLVLQYALYEAPSLCLAQPVIYTNKYPTVSLPSEDGDDLIKMLLTKHEGWEYERERRLIELRSSKTAIRLGALAVRAVILGCRMTSEARCKVIEIAERASQVRRRPILIYETHTAQTKFRLKVTRLHKRGNGKVRQVSAIA